MKRLIAMFGCAVLLAAAPPAAMAQPTKTVKGSVTAVGADSITVKVLEKDMTFAVDAKTLVVAPGGSTKARGAKAEGKAGPVLTDVVKTGQAVEVVYHEQGMHAATIRAIAAVPPAPAADAPKAQTASGVVSAVSGNSLTVKGSAGEWTFVVDPKTLVSGTGVGTAGRKVTEAGGKPTVPDLVHEGDSVSVTYHDVAGAKHASVIRITRRKM
jgi:cytoskeletal protein RodZ